MVAVGQRQPNRMRQRNELGAVAQAQVALIGQGGVNHLHDAPRAWRHHHNAGRQIHRLGNGVGHKHHGAAFALPKLLQLLIEPVAGDLVERAKRLVHHQNARFKRQGTGDRHPLLHAARQLPGVLALKPGEANAGQLLQRNAAALVTRAALDLQWQGHVGQHGAPRKQCRGLEHIAIGPV